MSDAQKKAIDAAVSAAATATQATMSESEKFGVLYDHGLAWVNFPVGAGGLAVAADLQEYAQNACKEAGLIRPDRHRASIGFGMAAPTIAQFGTPEQQGWLRDIFTLTIHVCQLFSEPGAGSDLAAVSTKAVLSEDGTYYTVTGQKVWTSGAHNADAAILVARTDPNAFKHAGLSYFFIDMHSPGIEVRGLRQITGEAEFNEVFLTEVKVPANRMLGKPGEGWKVANATLNSERVSIGGGEPREGGMMGVVAQAWRTTPGYRDPELHDDLIRLWVAYEGARILGERTTQKMAAGTPGPEGSAAKLAFARNAQKLSRLDMTMRGVDGLRYDEYEFRRPKEYSMHGRQAGYRYLRAKGNSIEGGTSEIVKNIIAERVLGLPREHREDKNIPFKDLPK